MRLGCAVLMVALGLGTPVLAQDLPARLSEGQAALDKQDWKTAVQAFDAAVKLDAKAASAWYGKARASFELGLLDDAADAARQAVELGQDDLEARRLLGRACLAAALATGDERRAGSVIRARLTDAETAFRKALEKDPNRAELHLLLGQTLEALERHDDAVQAFAEAARLGDKSGIYWIGRNHYVREKYAEAATKLAEATGSQPDNPDVWKYLAWSQEWLKQPDRASTTWLEMIKRHPKAQEPYDGLWRLHGQTGQMDEGLRAFRKAVEADPKNLKAHWYVVWFLSQKKDAAGAQKELDALLAKDADYPYAFKLRGEWKAAAGDLAGAIEDSKTALAKETERAKAESREEDAAILQQLDMYLFRLGEEKREYDQAIQGYTDALKDRKAPGNVLANFALTLRNAGKYAESEKQYLAAAAASPDEAEVYNDLGLLYEAQGKLVDAEAQYRKAIEVGGSVESIENLGKLFFRLGSYRNALRQFGRLLDREPSRPGAMFYYHLSRRALERASASGAGHAGHGH